MSENLYISTQSQLFKNCTWYYRVQHPSLSFGISVQKKVLWNCKQSLCLCQDRVWAFLSKPLITSMRKNGKMFFSSSHLRSYQCPNLIHTTAALPGIILQQAVCFRQQIKLSFSGVLKVVSIVTNLILSRAFALLIRRFIIEQLLLADMWLEHKAINGFNCNKTFS